LAPRLSRAFRDFSEDFGRFLKTFRNVLVEDARRYETGAESIKRFSGADDSRSDREKGKLMTTRTRTRITIQTRKTTVVQPTSVRCHQCGAEVPILTPASAAATLQTTASNVRGLLQSGELHTVAQQTGEELICGNSLVAASDEIQIEGERQ